MRLLNVRLVNVSLASQTLTLRSGLVKGRAARDYPRMCVQGNNTADICVIL